AVNDFMDSVHHIWCPLFSQEFQDLPDGAETTLTTNEYPEKNKQAVKHDIGDLAEHADTHGRNLTALGHILCVKTHDDIPKKKSQSD
ncbi:hypothetical protein, partial [Escherichia coli]